MRTPKISMISMESRDPSKCFVRIPNEPGRWVYTDRCVAEVECPHCEAAKGEPCHNGKGYYSQGTHHLRRSLWRHSKYKIPHDYIHKEDTRPRIRVYADMGGQ